jgi:copper resistance protein B
LISESGAEALWWHSTGPYWERWSVCARISARERLRLAAGVEGLAPYWFDVQLTGYVGSDGRLAARAKLSYEALLTNRLILTPQVEANVYSKQSRDRELGSGFSNVN